MWQTLGCVTQGGFPFMLNEDTKPFPLVLFWGSGDTI